MTEADVKRKVDALFTTAGWLRLIVNAGTAYGGRMKLAPAGFPDRVFFGPRGRVVLLEAKRPAGKLRPDQITMAQKLGRLGHTVYVVWSVESAVIVLRGGKV